MPPIDAKNRQILQILSQRGRISNLELASKVNLSPSACLRRVQELERSGVITGYRATTDAAALDRAFIAYVGLDLADHSKPALEVFEAAMAAAEEVRECHNVTGTFAYMLRVEVRDIAEYKRFHTDVLGALPLVRAITTYVVLGSPKDERV